MAIDMGKTIYAYDIESSTWFQVRNKRFYLKPDAPILALRSVVLGSKQIGPFTNKEIQHLFHRTFSTHLQDLTRRLDEFDLLLCFVINKLRFGSLLLLNVVVPKRTVC